MRILLAFFFSFILWSQNELFENRFDPTLYPTMDQELGSLAPFLAHYYSGDPVAAQETAVHIVKTFPDTFASEFVLLFLKDNIESLSGWLEEIGPILLEKNGDRPEYKSLRTHYLRLYAGSKGDRHILEKAVAESGYLTKWRFASLQGQYPIPAFARRLPPEFKSFWSADFPIESSLNGVVTPPAIARGPGVVYALSQFNVAKQGEFIFRVYAFQNVDLYLNGKKLFGHEALTNRDPKIKTFKATLAKGENQLVAKVTQTRGANGQFSVMVSGGIIEQDEPAISKHDLGAHAYPAQTFLPLLIEGGDFAKFCNAFYLFELGEKEKAYELLSKLQTQFPQSQMVGHWVARVLLESDFFSRDTHFGKAFTTLRDLVQQPSAHAENLILLAQLFLQVNRPEECLQLVQAGLNLQPMNIRGIDTALKLAVRENLRELLDQMKAKLQALGMQNGWAQQNLLELAKAEGNNEEIRNLLAHLSQLYPWDAYKAEWHELNQEFPEAIQSLLDRQSFFPENPYFPYRIATLYARQGLMEKQEEYLELALSIDPGDNAALRDLVDLYCYHGDYEGARKRIMRSLSEDPTNAHFRQMLAHIDGQTAFEDFRVNSEDVVRATMTRPSPQDADTELVLDQLMVRLFPDGSQMRYTHLLRRVLTKDGVDSESEIVLPGDVEILQLRTIKPDGTILYPADIEHKNSITLTGVSVGDFIDEEHIEYMPPAYYDRDGLDASMSFIFQGIDRAYFHSELVLVYPEGLEPEPVVFSNNFPFEVQSFSENGLKTVRWLAKEMPPINAEPAMPNPNYFLPNATFYFNTDFEEVRDFFLNATMTRMVPSQWLEREVKQWFPEEKDPLKRAEKIYHYVVNELEDESQFYKNINHVWESRSGNATLLLCYAFNQIGVPTNMVLTRPRELELIGNPIPIPDVYSYGLLRLETKDGPLYVDANQKHIPFGYVPYPYRGTTGLWLKLGEKQPQLQIPGGQLETEEIAFEYNLEVDSLGRMSGQGTERFSGAFGSQLKQRYEQLNSIELRQRIEVGINGNYPGAVVTSVELNDDKPNGKFEVNHVFEHEGFGRIVDQQMELPRLLPISVLLENYGQLPKRNLPLHIRRPLVNKGRVTVKLDSFLNWEIEPKVWRHETEFGWFELVVKQETPDQVQIRRAYHIPDQIIEPDQYPKFLEFLNQINENENTIQVRVNRDS